MHTPLHEWGTFTLTQYLYASLARKSDCDADAIISKYFSDVYGKYANEVKKAYDLIEKSTGLSMAYRGWDHKTVLTLIEAWDGKTPKSSFEKIYHLDDNAVAIGYEYSNNFKKALAVLRKVRTEALSDIGDFVSLNQGRAVNPEEQKKMLSGIPLLNKLNEDIRGAIYGRDVYLLMALCLDYYNSLYEKRDDSERIYEKIVALGNKMSEYTFGISFEAYTPDSELKTALKRSQLIGLYYRIVASHNKKP
jgi:hypothetical protein